MESKMTQEELKSYDKGVYDTESKWIEDLQKLKERLKEALGTGNYITDVIDSEFEKLLGE